MDDYRNNLIEFMVDSFINFFLMIFMAILFYFFGEIGLFVLSLILGIVLLAFAIFLSVVLYKTKFNRII